MYAGGAGPSGLTDSGNPAEPGYEAESRMPSVHGRTERGAGRLEASVRRGTNPRPGERDARRRPRSTSCTLPRPGATSGRPAPAPSRLPRHAHAHQKWPQTGPGLRVQRAITRRGRARRSARGDVTGPPHPARAACRGDERRIAKTHSLWQQQGLRVNPRPLVQGASEGPHRDGMRRSAASRPCRPSRG